MRPNMIPAVLVAMLLVGAACGDDDDETTADSVPATTGAAPPTTAAPTPSAPATETPAVGETAIDPADAEFCAVVAEINNLEAFPTVDDIRAYQEVAPDELTEPTQVLIDTLEAADGDFTAVFGDEAAGAALEQITAVEGERCGAGDAGPEQDPSVTVVDVAATRVDVVASEFAFALEPPSEPGRHSFVMANEGEQPHLMILLRLEEGAVLDDMMSSQGEEGVAEQFESSVAGPGGEGVLTADLGPGNWVLLCPIPSPDGPPHFVDGMITEFTVG
jgi:hypothetical protein